MYQARIAKKKTTAAPSTSRLSRSHQDACRAAVTARMNENSTPVSSSGTVSTGTVSDELGE